MVYTYDPLTVDPLPGGSIRPRSLKCSLVDSCLGHSAGNHGWFPCKSCLNMCYFFLQFFSSTIFKQFCRILACNMAESVVRSKSGSWDRWWLGSIEFGLRCFESLLWTRWPLVCFGSLAARECAQFLSQRELLGDLPQTACLSSWKSNLKAAKETLGFSGLHISSRGFQLWAIIGVVWS